MTAKRIVTDHKELDNIGTLTHDQIDVAVNNTEWIITSSSVEQPTNARKLTAGSGIQIDDHGPGAELIISSTASGSSGIDESVHESLNTLAHYPVQNGVDDVQYNTWGVTDYILWTNGSRNVKLQDYKITYNSIGLISQLTGSTYNSDGTVKTRLLETPTYDSLRRIVSIDRVKVV